MSPEALYKKKIEDYKESLSKKSRVEDWCANGRLVLFVVTAIVAWVSYSGEARDLLPALAPFSLFVALAVFHSVVLERIRRLEVGKNHFQQGLRRIQGSWAGHGTVSRGLEPEGHVFARDLDLFGKGSLFDLLDTTYTREGQKQLATWLLEASTAAEITARQQAVIELSGAVEDRESLAVHCGTRKADASQASLGEWAGGVDSGGLASLTRITVVTSALTVALITLTALKALPSVAYLTWPFAAWALSRYSKSFRGKSELALCQINEDLSALRSLLRVARSHRAASNLLTQIDSTLFDSKQSAEKLLGRLAFLTSLKDTQRNQLFAPVAFLLMWDPVWVILIEQWRQKHGRRLLQWVHAAAQRDALMALAVFHFEHDDYSLPSVLPEQGEPPSFSAKGLEHPFLPKEGRIPNDVCLGNESQVFMLSGSNMSGKSTLLRSVGINTVLALAGTAVCAKELVLSPVHLGATLRVHDSLLDGRSRFYAEIERLSELLSIARSSQPLLFLIDEIFHGTNSAARSTGARKLIESFLETRSIGLVTTHDLALAHGVESMRPTVENMHLRDHIVDGELSFDYELRPGILKEGNALRLMRAVGLPI